jgi:hypothetical protein
LGELLKEGALAHEDIVFWRASSIATAKNLFLYACHHSIYRFTTFYRGLEARFEEAEIPKEFYSQEGCNSATQPGSASILKKGKKLILLTLRAAIWGLEVPISISCIVFWRCLQPQFLYLSYLF